jgi:hypothetical protein
MDTRGEKEKMSILTNLETHNRERERKELGFNSWNEATKVAEDRDKWKRLENGPNLQTERQK